MNRNTQEYRTLYRNDWFRDWLFDNQIADCDAAYNAALDKKRLDDLISRAEVEKEKPARSPGGRSLIAGRSLDLTPYLSCDHHSCMADQVDNLFGHVWHYFDKIAIVGPDKHSFLETIYSGTANSEQLAMAIAARAFPIFHIRHIGADNLVTWVTKPPVCIEHWPEYATLEDYQIPVKAATALASQLASEGKVTLEGGSASRPAAYRISHKDLYGGFYEVAQQNLLQFRAKEETIGQALARYAVAMHWIGAASDIYSARSIGLPLGLGIGLEAKLAQIRDDKVSPADVAFNLNLPVIEGLPMKELIALRHTEGDAFIKFQDSVARAIKDGIKDASPADDAHSIACEIQADVIQPALNEIQQRLSAAKGVLQKTHRYNIALAGLSTTCGLVGAPSSLAIGLGVAAAAGAVAVESKLIGEKKDISLLDMYFLWRANERARTFKSKTQPPQVWPKS